VYRAPFAGGGHYDERPKGGGDAGDHRFYLLLFLINTHLGAQMKLRHKVPITARLGVISFAPKVDLGPKVNYFDPAAAVVRREQMDKFSINLSFLELSVL
jgi:hypothetical protein